MRPSDRANIGRALGADVRVRLANAFPVRSGGEYVLYWMIAARRPGWNHALDRAVAWARELDRPLVVLEALRAGYAHASDRLHRFVIDGMADNGAAFGRTPALYYPYVEPEPDAGKGLLGALAVRACVVVTDEFPCFFLPRMVEAAARKIDACLEVVDGNGLLPLAAADRAFTSAFHFRRFVQRELPEQLGDAPRRNSFAGARLPPPPTLPKEVTRRWPVAGRALLDGDVRALRRLPIDHSVPAVPTRGGAGAAARELRRFMTRRFDRYAELHNEPEAGCTSRLSPYLHFGHVSAHQIFAAVMRREGWTPNRLGSTPTGTRSGWWGVGESAEAYLDQLVVWRELGYNFCAKRPDDYDRYASLPDWARETLAQHAGDTRPHLYSRAQLETAETQDALFNAAQGQLLRDGWFHNYARMLWGKKILEWSRTPREALATMIEIMNRWSLDGRNPNSYTGYFWTLGRYDRPWPERPVYGKVRSMSSERTAKKLAVGEYIERYAPGAAATAGTRVGPATEPDGGTAVERGGQRLLKL